jgi:hypothetical protein
MMNTPNYTFPVNFKNYHQQKFLHSNLSLEGIQTIDQLQAIPSYVSTVYLAGVNPVFLKYLPASVSHLVLIGQIPSITPETLSSFPKTLKVLTLQDVTCKNQAMNLCDWSYNPGAMEDDFPFSIQICGETSVAALSIIFVTPCFSMRIDSIRGVTVEQLYSLLMNKDKLQYVTRVHLGPNTTKHYFPDVRYRPRRPYHYRGKARISFEEPIKDHVKLLLSACEKTASMALLRLHQE